MIEGLNACLWRSGGVQALRCQSDLRLLVGRRFQSQRNTITEGTWA